MSKKTSDKDYLITSMFSLFLGGFGIDRFYLEKYGTGILKLLTNGGFGIWYFVDLYLILSGKMTDKQERQLKDFKKNQQIAISVSTLFISIQIVAFIIIWGMLKNGSFYGM